MNYLNSLKHIFILEIDEHIYNLRPFEHLWQKHGGE